MRVHIASAGERSPSSAFEPQIWAPLPVSFIPYLGLLPQLPSWVCRKATLHMVAAAQVTFVWDSVWAHLPQSS
jgi:hypothetical protein